MNLPGQLLTYQTSSGKIKTIFEKDTVWLSVEQIAELFQRAGSVICKHIWNIFKEDGIKESRRNNQ